MNKALPKICFFAAGQVAGFESRLNMFEQRMRLDMRSASTRNAYSRSLARISLYFKLLPEQLTLQQINDYMDEMIKSARVHHFQNLNTSFFH